MLRAWRNSVVTGLCILSAAVCNAKNDTIYHDLSELNTEPRQIEFTDGNKKGVTDMLTYTCADGADFGRDLEYNTYISVRIPKTKWAKVTTSALEELKGVIIDFWPTSKLTDFQVRVSRDSVTWTTITGSDLTSTAGRISAVFPRHTYYVQVRNSGTKQQMSIHQFTYIFEHCNCFEYESGE